MALTRTIVGIGEALFDVFGDEQRLGGAPLNVACHANQLGNRGLVVSRIGQDELGRLLADELRQRGLSTDHLQTDPDRPTGTVRVETDQHGQPTYTVTEGVAWDAIQYDPDLEDVARSADAVCFGTLAHRDAQSRNTIYRFLQEAERGVRLLDVNLRQRFYDRRMLERSLELASAAKVNEDELAVLQRTFNLPDGEREAIDRLRSRFALRWVALTRGEGGTEVFDAAAHHQAEPVHAEAGGDAVGAGDAAAAALLHGAVRAWPWDRTLTLANTVGAHVASQPGACPELGEQIRQLAGAGSGG